MSPPWAIQSGTASDEKNWSWAPVWPLIADDFWGFADDFQNLTNDFQNLADDFQNFTDDFQNFMDDF